jgi:hypothetical protein
LIREHNGRHDPLHDPDYERHAMFDRASTPEAPVQGPGPVPILRKAGVDEIVIAPVDQYGREIGTAWVVDSVGVHWVKTHLLQDPTITRILKHEDIALTGRDGDDNEIKVEPREFHVPTGPQPRPSVTKIRSRRDPQTGYILQMPVTEYADEAYVKGAGWRTSPSTRA